MSTNSTSGQVSKPNPEQLLEIYETFDGQSKEIRRQLREGTLSTVHVQALIDHREVFVPPTDAATSHIEVLREPLPPCAERSVDVQIAEWRVFYREIGWKLDESGIVVPDRRTDFDRLIVIPKGMMPQKAYDICDERFNGAVWKYTTQSLDTAVPINDRDAKSGTYAIWVRDRVEADEELKDLSTNILAELKIKGITLTERLLYELKYHSETKKHLDVKYWTLCSGSHDSVGDGPRVGWGTLLEVYWRRASGRSNGLRTRAVIAHH